MRTTRILLPGVLITIVLGIVFVASSSRSAAQTGQNPVSEIPPGGMEIGISPDQHQFTNPAIPVVVFGTVSGRSEPEPNKKPQSIIKEVILENRSTTDVSAVTVRWVIVPSLSRTVPLARGEFKTHDLHALRTRLRAGQRQTLQLSAHPRLFDLVKEVPNVDAMGNKFVFLIGVANVVFEDGTSWTEKLLVPTTKLSALNVMQNRER